MKLAKHMRRDSPRRRDGPVAVAGGQSGSVRSSDRLIRVRAASGGSSRGSA